MNSNDDYVLQISIDDVQSDVMNEVLNFMYTNRCLISLKNAPDLLVAAKRFELERLRKQISEFLLSRLTVDNAIEMLICSHEAGSDALKAACIRLINRHAEKIKRTEKWKTFKTEYVDLVPELYEHRVERPVAQPQAYLPDVFSPGTAPPENLLALTRMYDNPVKKRLASPTPRLLPPPPKPEHIQPNVQQVHHHHSEPMKASKSIPPHGHGHGSQSPHTASRGSQPKKKTTTNTNNNNNNNNNNNRRRPGPVIAPPTLVRNVYPTVRESPDIDVYRRPVNIYDKTSVLPNHNQTSRIVNHHTTHKSGPATGGEKMTRTISPQHLIEVERSPTLSSFPREDQMTLARVVSVDTME